MRGYTQEHKTYLLSFKDSGLSYTEITKLFNEKFNENKNNSDIRQVCVRLGFTIRRNTPHTYTEEQITFLKDNIENTFFDVLTKAFNEKFNLNLSYDAIRNVCYRLGLRNNCPGGFMGSEQHWAKGLTKEEFKAHFTEQSYENTLKALRKNQYVVPLGGTAKSNGKELIVIENSNGKGKSLSKRSIYKNRFIYEQTYGKIPKGSKIIHLDGDYENYNLDNLHCVTHKEFAQLIHSPSYNQGKITKAMLEIIRTKQTLKDLKEKE